MSASKVFAVYDVKVGAYLQPIFFRSNGEAIRSFSAAARDESSQICKFATDYTLFELGTFEDETGRFSLLDAPVPLGTAQDFIPHE